MRYMIIYLGADHRGFPLKEVLKSFLSERGYTVQDLGAAQVNPTDDYVDYAKMVGEFVAQNNEAFGIVVCGSGVGVDMAANKIAGIRAGLGFSKEEIQAARADDNINVLALPADFVTEEQAKEITSVFLETPFKNEEKYTRRIEKLEDLEHE